MSFFSNLFQKAKNIVNAAVTSVKQLSNAMFGEMIDSDITNFKVIEEPKDLELTNEMFGVNINNKPLKEKTLDSIFNSINSNTKEKIIKLDDKITILDVLKRIQQYNDRMPYLEYNGNYYILSRNNIRHLMDKFYDNDNPIFQNEVDIDHLEGSDAEFFLHFINSIRTNTIKIGYIDYTKKKKKEGAFFGYTHKLDFDLSRYQISKDNDLILYDDNCFIHALKMSGVLNEKQINNIKIKCINDYVVQKDIKQIAFDNKICITVRRLKNNSKESRVIKFNDKCEKVINLGLLDEHYFLIEPVKITTYSIKNYDLICHNKKWNMYIKENEKSKKDYIDSFKVIKLLLSNKDKLLTKLNYEDLVDNNLYNKKNKTISSLKYDEKLNTRKMIFKEKEKVKYNDVVFFDFETYNDENHKHNPFLLSKISNDDIVKSYFGDNLIIDFLEDLKDDSLCIAHNLGYDIRFLLKYLGVKSIIKKSNTKIIYVVGSYKSKSQNKLINLTFKCSLAMIDCKLSLFSSIFNIKDIKKEIMPYSFYNKQTLTEKKVLIKDALVHLEEKDRIEFVSNLKTLNFIKDEIYFDHIGYSKFYCEQDVKLTKKGYNIFKEWIMEVTELDINSYITLASISFAYLLKRNCFDDCYEFSGVVREFIQKTVVGGRTMVNQNQKLHVKETLVDFDGVSLYPSAMARMTGFLKGKPKIIKKKDLNYNFLQKQSGYYVEINVTKVNKNRDLPLINILKKGIRDFNNNITGVLYVDKTTLEDLIEYHKIEFKIIRGYYFNDGHNTKIKEVITFLFNERKKKKKEGNPIQNTYKLLMNSCYGKTCLKPIEDETMIINESKFNSYLINNYNYIKNYSKIENSNKIVINSVKKVNDHFNCCHIGSEILSVSKRIMNEVITLAEDNNIKIYYQDTDSMHMKNTSVKILDNLFREKYKRELIGKDLGQFHSDFELKVNGKEAENVVSVESYFLGKKSYIDKLEGEINGVKVNGYHIRMKGIPNNVILHKAKSMFKNNPLALYEHLYDSKELEFNLLDNGSINGGVFFKGTNNFNISSLIEFKRKLKF